MLRAIEGVSHLPAHFGSRLVIALLTIKLLLLRVLLLRLSGTILVIGHASSNGVAEPVLESYVRLSERTTLNGIHVAGRPHRRVVFIREVLVRHVALGCFGSSMELTRLLHWTWT